MWREVMPTSTYHDSISGEDHGPLNFNKFVIGARSACAVGRDVFGSLETSPLSSLSKAASLGTQWTLLSYSLSCLLLAQWYFPSTRTA